MRKFLGVVVLAVACPAFSAGIDPTLGMQFWNTISAQDNAAANLAAARNQREALEIEKVRLESEAAAQRTLQSQTSDSEALRKARDWESTIDRWEKLGPNKQQRIAREFQTEGDSQPAVATPDDSKKEESERLALMASDCLLRKRFQDAYRFACDAVRVAPTTSALRQRGYSMMMCGFTQAGIKDVLRACRGNPSIEDLGVLGFGYLKLKDRENFAGIFKVLSATECSTKKAVLAKRAWLKQLRAAADQSDGG